MSGRRPRRFKKRLGLVAAASAIAKVIIAPLVASEAVEDAATLIVTALVAVLLWRRPALAAFDYVGHWLGAVVKTSAAVLRVALALVLAAGLRVLPVVLVTLVVREVRRPPTLAGSGATAVILLKDDAPIEQCHAALSSLYFSGPQAQKAERVRRNLLTESDASLCISDARTFVRDLQ